MSKPKLAAVVVTVGVGHRGSKASPFDLGRRTVWLFEVNENYSLDAVQSFFAGNEHIFGGDMHVRFELARFKSIKRLAGWAERKGRNAAGLAPLTGWHGPLRLAEAA